KPRTLTESIGSEELVRRGIACGLCEKYLFSNFVVGENSELAVASAKAVADKPGRTYQPLFFHSGCGLGKTHLLHAIGWESLRQRPKSKIIFVSAEEFSNDYITAIREGGLVKFRKKYREADLLLIDDVQFLGSKEGLQKEFFHTFNSLSEKRKQIVLASDCPASEINMLEDRLVSRFQWGLSAEILRPGAETRNAILRKKRDDWEIDVSDDVISVIVSHVRGNVRLLEGALIRIGMVAMMNDAPVLPENVLTNIADMVDVEQTRQISFDEIKLVVCEHYDIEMKELESKKRTQRIAEGRQVAMYLMRDLTESSLVEVASSFGKDHGTVIYAVKKIKARMASSSAFKSQVELLKRRLLKGGTNPRSGKSGTNPMGGVGGMGGYSDAQQDGLSFDPDGGGGAWDS
ncbi:MAG: chromosomal replication initiator protein DnaA, partial [Verrucomicrobiota bacterium]